MLRRLQFRRGDFHSYSYYHPKCISVKTIMNISYQNHYKKISTASYSHIKAAMRRGGHNPTDIEVGKGEKRRKIISLFERSLWKIVCIRF